MGGGGISALLAGGRTLLRRLFGKDEGAAVSADWVLNARSTFFAMQYN
jgi:hypothetical protein